MSELCLDGLAAADDQAAPLLATVGRLVADAADALQEDHENARALLDRAAALLHAGQANTVAARPAPARAVLAPWQARRVADHIDAHLSQTLRLADLATVARLSTSYFSRAFKGTFGKAPHAFIIERRIARAQQEMLAADEPLSQIAIACGFSDQAHLSRAFRRLTGRTPHAWRRARRARPLHSPFRAHRRDSGLQPTSGLSKTSAPACLA